MSWQATPAHIFAALQTRKPRRVFENLKESAEVVTLDGPGPVPVHIVACSGVRFSFSGTKLSSITVERCEDVTVELGSVIGAVEVIRCSRTLLSVPGETAGTVTLDNCKACRVDLRVAPGTGDLQDALRRCSGMSVFSSACEGATVGIAVEGSTAELPRYAIPDDAKDGNRLWRHRTRVLEGKTGTCAVGTQLVNLYGDVVSDSG
ncbi:hypothetical protein DFJ74DRAFT_700920 [Hyaloraphidium curvatum]|nr:hypothetical protein DFJ74DRAFT_700920 [Hyaloraphidium curvatum]